MERRSGRGEEEFRTVFDALKGAKLDLFNSTGRRAVERILGDHMVVVVI